MFFAKSHPKGWLFRLMVKKMILGGEEVAKPMVSCAKRSGAACGGLHRNAPAGAAHPLRDVPPRESHQSAPGALPVRAGSPRTPVCPKDEANIPPAGAAAKTYKVKKHLFASNRQLLQHHRAGDALRRGPSGSPRGVVRGLGRIETPQRALGTFARSKVPSGPCYACRQVLI